MVLANASTLWPFSASCFTSALITILCFGHPYWRCWQSLGWRSLSFSGRQVPGRLVHAFPHSVDACKTSALSHLRVNAPNYFVGGLADSYHREYNSTQRRFLQFCQEFSLVPLPASEKTIILFSTHLAQRIKQQQLIFISLPWALCKYHTVSLIHFNLDCD